MMDAEAYAQNYMNAEEDDKARWGSTPGHHAALSRAAHIRSRSLGHSWTFSVPVPQNRGRASIFAGPWTIPNGCSCALSTAHLACQEGLEVERPLR
jgi:hypothetical protein